MWIIVLVGNDPVVLRAYNVLQTGTRLVNIKIYCRETTFYHAAAALMVVIYWQKCYVFVESVRQKLILCT